MTKLQKAFCIFLCLCFLMVLAMLPEPFSLWKVLENMYRQFPFYYFTEEKVQEAWLEMDSETLAEIGKRNREYLGKIELEEKKREEEKRKEERKAERKEKKEEGEKTEENTKSEEKNGKSQEVINSVLPHPILDLSRDKLSDYDYLMNNFYIVDENTDASAVKIDAAEFLAEDFSLSHGPLEPQILIYHSHSQETFSDSREGEEEDTIVGVGNYLTNLLREKYGYQVIHVKEAFDMMSGELDRSKAYDYACEYVENVLKENPSVEVLIDLHRDGIPENRRLVTEINGKATAQVLF